MVTADRPTRAPSLGEQLAELLRDRIVRRVIAPGTHLVEDALAAQYDVSRGPVRDALRELERQGLVESRRRGYFVVGLTARDVDDLYELREAIEVVAATKAVELADANDIAAARQVVAEMIAAADAASPLAFAKADLRFHALIYRMGGNRRLIDVWEEYQPVISSLMQLTVEEDVDLHPSAHDHGVLIDLLESGSTDELAAEMRDHLRGAHSRMVRSLAAMPDSPDTEERAS